MDESRSHDPQAQSWEAGYESPEQAENVVNAVDASIMVLEEAPAALTLDVWEPTGDAVVDGALERLATIPTAELSDQVAIFGTIHDELRARLSDLSS